MRGENRCFQQFLRSFSTPPPIGRRVVGVTARFHRSDGAVSRLAFQTQKKTDLTFSTAVPEKRERKTNRGLSFPEHTPASSGCLRFFFHRWDCHRQLTDVIAAANTSRRQQPRGKWVVRGTPQGATSSNRVAITTATAPIHGFNKI